MTSSVVKQPYLKCPGMSWVPGPQRQETDSFGYKIKKNAGRVSKSVQFPFSEDKPFLINTNIVYAEYGILFTSYRDFLNFFIGFFSTFFKLL